MTRIKRPPLTIQPGFWLISGILGWLITQSWWGALLMVAVLLISVLVHELGHAAAYIAFGKRVSIELTGFGGSTTGYGPGPRDTPLSVWQQLLVELAGPTAGVLLAGLALLLNKSLPELAQTPVGQTLESLWAINIILSLGNLLPVLPLDGGQIVRTLVTAVFGQRALRGVFLLSAALAIFFAFGSLYWLGSVVLMAIFGLLTVQNAVAWTTSRNLVEADLDTGLRDTFELAMEALASKRYDEAQNMLQQVCEAAPGGLLDVAAHEQLAQLEERRGNYQEAFNLLEPLLARLSPEALLLYQELALTLKHYDKVCAVGDLCFREAPSELVALRNSLSYAALGKVGPAMGWFEAAWENGLPNAPAILTRCEYDPIKQSKAYQHAFQTIDRRTRESSPGYGGGERRE